MIYSDGQSPTVGTPIRNILYQGPEGLLIGVVEIDGRFFIHSVMLEPWKPSAVRTYREILAELEKGLRDRGFTQYFTMADSQSGFRYNEMLGFRTALEVWDDKYEVMVKDL